MPKRSNSRSLKFTTEPVVHFLTDDQFNEIAKIMEERFSNIRSLFSGRYGGQFMRVGRSDWNKEVINLQDTESEPDGRFIINCIMLAQIRSKRTNKRKRMHTITMYDLVDAVTEWQKEHENIHLLEYLEEIQDHYVSEHEDVEGSDEEDPNVFVLDMNMNQIIDK